MAIGDIGDRQTVINILLKRSQTLLGGDFTRKKSSAKVSRLNPQQVKWVIFYRLKNIFRQVKIIQFRSFRLNEPNKLLTFCLNDEIYKKVLKWP